MTPLTPKYKKKDTGALLQSLGAGVVPKIGLPVIAVGREVEIKQILKELENVRQGTAGMKVIAGNFGSGKTFMLRLTRAFALDAKFVVADADFSVERRLTGEGYGLALYREMVKNLATSSRPENAMEAIVEKWLSDIQRNAAKERGMAQVRYDDPALVLAVQTKVDENLKGLEELTGGFAFREVLKSYYRGYAEDNEEQRRAALRWLRGEYDTRTEAKKDLGVREIIDDENWYDHLKLISRFVVGAGFSGLVVVLDESVNLYKISHLQSRQKNYEALLKLYNDTNQGGAAGLYVMLGATVETVTDERRGFASYDALKTRLRGNPFEKDGYRDFSQPVIALPVLRPEHQYVLLKKLRDIHAFHNDMPPACTDEEVEKFLLKMLNRPGASQNMTPRDIIRRFLDALNILQQNPTMPRQSVFKEATARDLDAGELATRRDDLVADGGPPSSPEPVPDVRSRFQHTG